MQKGYLKIFAVFLSSFAFNAAFAAASFPSDLPTTKPAEVDPRMLDAPDYTVPLDEHQAKYSFQQKGKHSTTRRALIVLLFTTLFVTTVGVIFNEMERLKAQSEKASPNCDWLYRKTLEYALRRT